MSLKIVNYALDPALRTRIPSGWNSTRERDEDGHIVMTPLLQGGVNFVRGTIKPLYNGEQTTGKVFAVTMRNNDGNFSAANYIRTSTGVTTATYTDSDAHTRTYYMTCEQQESNLEMWVYNTPVTILGVGLYTPDGWQQVCQLAENGQLELPWFDGDSKPK